MSSSSQFEYAWCLVRSRYPADIKKGIILLEDLFKVAHLILLLFRMANITFFTLYGLSDYSSEVWIQHCQTWT